MPYAIDDSVRIHYEVEGSGPPWFFGCLYTGGADGTVQQSERCAREIPKASFMLFPCFDHAGTFRRSVVLPPVLEFLETHTERVGL
jgi:hypothetical protein